MPFTYIRPPNVAGMTISSPYPEPDAPYNVFLRIPRGLPVIKITFTDPLRFTARPRFVSGYLAAGLSRR